MPARRLMLPPDARGSAYGQRTLVHSARLITATPREETVDQEDTWVIFDDTSIEQVGRGTSWRHLVRPGDRVIDALEEAGAGAILSAGLIDIHNHGGMGASYDQGVDAIMHSVDFHARMGTTRMLASLVSAPPDVLLDQLDDIAAAMSVCAGILGAHLEGPYIAPAYCGAHDPAVLLVPDATTVAALLARRIVRQVTIAPELPGAIEAIRQIARSGAIAAVGHTAANADETRSAADAGASLITHIFNAMPPLHHRRPGPIGAAIDDPRYTLELIADGMHITPPVIRLLFAAAPSRIALVSDALAATGATDGRYPLGNMHVHVTQGRAYIEGTSTIAGSTATLSDTVRFAVEAGVPAVAAITAATSTPARAIGAKRVGKILPGYRADVVLWTAALKPHQVWRNGVCLT